jgi:hypothetical protein
MGAAELLQPVFANDVVAGLGSYPKSLPPWLFYDARGSSLFEEITCLPEYYLTRTEHEILENHAPAILDCAGSNLALIELGAGTAEKTRTLISVLLRRQRCAGDCPAIAGLYIASHQSSSYRCRLHTGTQRDWAVEKTQAGVVPGFEHRQFRAGRGGIGFAAGARVFAPRRCSFAGNRPGQERHAVKSGVQRQSGGHGAVQQEPAGAHQSRTPCISHVSPPEWRIYVLRKHPL